MAINGLSSVGTNSGKFNYSTLKPTTNKNYVDIEKSFSTESTEEGNSEESSSFAKILQSLFGSNKKVSSAHGQYKPATYSAEEQASYEQLAEAGDISLSKFYTGVKYQKYLKKAKEFEELLKKLLSETQKNNAVAKEALDLIESIIQDSQKSGKSPEETLSNLMGKINDYIEEFNNLRKLHPEKVSDQQAKVVDLMSGILNRTANDSDSKKVDNINKAAEKAKRFDDKKSEQDFYDVITDKVKQKNPYDPTKSTKKYLKKRKQEEEVNSKIQEIVKFRPGAERATANEEISKIINDISKADPTESTDNTYLFDFNRLNRSIQSPVFA